MFSSRHQIRLNWLPPAAGGRKSAFAGNRYTPTARFSGKSDQFSVVLEFAPDAGAYPTSGTMRLLFPDSDDIAKSLHRGANLEIMEGSRLVASCIIESPDGEPSTTVAR
jgi:hypothetical protein